jgi:hypothetical protein
MTSNFFVRIFKKPPILFPMAALFQWIMTFIAAWMLYPVPLSEREWMGPLSLLACSIVWLFVCDMRKWAAFAYLTLTIACLLLFYFCARYSAGWYFAYAPLPFNMIMGLFVLFYYKRFQ